MNAPKSTSISLFRHVDLKASQAALPLDWNPAYDMALLLGEGLEELAAWLAAEGSERVVLRRSPGAQRGELPASIQLAECEDSTRSALMAFPEPMPHHLTVFIAESFQPQAEQMELVEWLGNLLSAKSIFHNTVESIGPIIVEQGMRNIPMIAAHPSIASLKGQFQGKPALIVSPGPSLSKNIELVKEFKGKAVIITGTHSLSAFKRAGVHPDIVLAVDVGDLATHYEDYDMTGVEVLMLGNTTRRMHFEQAAKRIITLPSNKNSDEWFYQACEETMGLHTGGSVACTSLSLAEAMGCSPILFAGQDLSFPGDKYYADECVHGSVEVVPTEKGFYLKADDHLIEDMQVNDEGDLCFTKEISTIEVPGYHGGMVRTSKILRGFLWWFENFIKHRSGLGPVWNCTEGGARIDGAQQMTLQHALDALGTMQTDVPAILKRCLASHDTAKRRDALLAHFQGIKSELELCALLAERCKDAVPAAATDRWSLSKLETLEARLTEASQSVTCLALFAQREITATISEARNAPDLARNLTASLRLYDIIQRASNFLLEPLEEGLEELAAMECDQPALEAA